MLQAYWQTAADLNLLTDASGTLGFGAYFKGAWIMGTKEQLSRSNQWKELFAIIAAADTWGNKWQRQKIVVYCDNQAAYLTMAFLLLLNTNKLWHSDLTLC